MLNECSCCELFTSLTSGANRFPGNFKIYDVSCRMAYSSYPTVYSDLQLISWILSSSDLKFLRMVFFGLINLESCLLIIIAKDNELDTYFVVTNN